MPSLTPQNLTPFSDSLKCSVIQIFICIITAGLSLYLYIDKQNELTQLRLSIPALTKEVKRINEENIRLQYEIEQFESPVHLMELARKPEFGHLKYPNVDQVLILPEGVIPPEIGGQ